MEALQNLACLVENTSNVWTSTCTFPHRNFVDSSRLNLPEVGAAIMFTKSTGNESNFVIYSYHALLTFKRFVGFSPNIMNLVINMPFKCHFERSINSGLARTADLSICANLKSFNSLEIDCFDSKYTQKYLHSRLDKSVGISNHTKHVLVVVLNFLFRSYKILSYYNIST